MDERSGSSSLDDLGPLSSHEDSLPDVESLMDNLLEITNVDDEHQVSCMDRKEQWALRLLSKWGTNNLDCIKYVLTDDNENCVNFTSDMCLNPEEILLKGSLPAIDNLLSSFLVGARQNKCGKQYSADSLRQVVMAIQRYLRRHQRFVSLLTDPQFSLLQASIALEAVDRLSNSTVRKSTKPEILPISEGFIHAIWQSCCLGFHEPSVLLDTLIFYVGLNFGLTSGHSLRNINFGQNIFFKPTVEGATVVSYRTVIKTGSGPPKTIEVDAGGDLFEEKSLHHILSTYLSYRPEEASTDGPLFLQPCIKFGCTEWYSSTPMGKDSLSKALQRIVKRSDNAADSVNSSQLKMAAAIRLASSGHPHQVIKHLTGFSKSQYEHHLEHKEAAQNQSNAAKRSVDDVLTDDVCSSASTKQMKLSELDGTTESVALVPFVPSPTPSTVISVPVNVIKLLGDILPQRIRVTSVLDCIFLSGNLESHPMRCGVPLWLHSKNTTSARAEDDLGFPPREQALYKGFVMDMLNALCEKIGVEFAFDLTPDDRFGFVKDGQWHGVVGQVHRGEADLGGAALTVTSERYDAVDFCHPFYTTTLHILYTKTPQTCIGAPFYSLREALNSDYFICAYPAGIYSQHILQRSALVRETLEKVSSSGRMFDCLADAVNAMEKDNQLVLLINKEHAELIVRKRPHKFGMVATSCLSRHYAFATPKGSPLCRKLSYHVMELMEEGKVEELLHKWCFNQSMES